MKKIENVVQELIKNKSKLKEILENHKFRSLLTESEMEEIKFRIIYAMPELYEDVGYVSDETNIKFIKAEVTNIKYIKNPSIKVIKQAIEEDAMVISYINPELITDNLKLLAVKKNGYTINFIANPTEEMQKEAIKNYPFAIQYIKNPTYEMMNLAIELNPQVVYALGELPKELQLKAINLAIEQDKNIIRHMTNPCEEVQLLSVKNFPDSVYDIKNPTEHVQLEAVKTKCTSIKYIKNPSEQLQLEAIKNDCGFVVKYIENPTEKVQLMVIEENPELIKLIKKQSKDAKLVAVKRDGMLLKFIKNPSKEVQMEAIKQNGMALQFVKNPTEEMEKIAEESLNKRNNTINYNPVEKAERDELLSVIDEIVKEEKKKQTMKNN